MVFKRSYTFVGKKIERHIPEVKKRNKEALLWTGGEPCLLYLPDGVIDDANWDDVRQTYKTKEHKYKLYLNRYMDNGCRLYTNDTDRVPSILIAFPSNPDAESHREEGFVIVNRMNAWTLWDPILPVKGAIIVRQIPGNKDEMYLLENVTHSWFPKNFCKDRSHLLHQETPLTQLENGTPVKLSDLPTVEDTLSQFSNDMEFNLNDFTIVGSATPGDDGTVLTAGSNLQQTDSWLNNKIKVDIKPLANGGVIHLSWGKWVDNSKPVFKIDRTANTVSISMNDITLVKQANFTMNTNETYNVRAEIDNGKAVLWIGDSKVLEANLFIHSSYNILQPLIDDYFEIGTTGINILIHNFYILELI